jgi:diaminohydroxyphosphoribosylaminopyrimidine deaminase / 5-amino-6-(5-phosphoribosylamino)uracil reductase
LAKTQIETFSKADRKYMAKAIRLAQKGKGHVSPNPLVGAVIVKDDCILGKGFHQKFGAAHAEVNALKEAGDDAAGATLYINLEPCSHHGKTGPCVEQIWEAGICRVVVGMKDPNPLVNGSGINYLRSRGIPVSIDVLNIDCVELNEGYIKYHSDKRPLITLKMGQTIDGRIATSTGHSRWITSEEARTMAHRLRAQNDAILTGIGTIIMDDPNLTVRHVTGVSPKRLILDSKLRIPLDAKVISDDTISNTIVITTELASKDKVSRIEEKGAKVLVREADERGWVTQADLWTTLGEIGLTSVLVEGGSTVHTECIKTGFVDYLTIFIAPKIMGTGIDAIGDLNIRNVNNAISVSDIDVKKIGPDVMLRGRISYNPSLA